MIHFLHLTITEKIHFRFSEGRQTTHEYYIPVVHACRSVRIYMYIILIIFYSVENWVDSCLQQEEHTTFVAC